MKIQYFLLVMMLAGLSSCLEEFPYPANTYRENFETLWKIVDTRYCYLDVKKINWDSIRTVYESRLATDTVDEETFFYAMADMLAELKDGHVNLYSAFDRSRYWNWFTDHPANFNTSLIYEDRYLGNDYRVVNGLRYQRIADGKVGYVYYSSFGDSFSDRNISYLFQYFMSCENGLIIDVRNNGGGSADLSGRLASYFFERDTVSMYLRHKTGSGHMDFSEPVPMKTTANKKIQWRRPVIILTNRASYSATNLFVCMMKDAPQALIIGDKTGGGGGLPLSNELPNGWMVRFSASPMYDGKMQHIEFGIDPDIKVDLDLADVVKGKDTLIEYAVDILTRP
ncbi:MAG: S41 family peptidase [Paludibacter sp.]|nr:S41 family peptidase [Paludibacter sp.]MDD4197939.1 S41 family peptidase [Paludibacter sp.]MDD4427246.1 S41 family peptidase [Paludibacter sp.]